MQLAYNGAVFKIARIDGWRVNAVQTQDRSNFCMWHHQINCICVINPQVTTAAEFMPRGAVLRGAGGRQGGAGGDKRKAPETFLDLVARLAQQRQRLVIWMDSDPPGPQKKRVLLDSPGLAANGQTLPSDALHGPQCLVKWVVPDGANMGFSLGMEFHTWVPIGKTEGLYVLDHRWTYRVTHDEDYYATHMVSGNVTFNVGLLAHAKLTPDLLRPIIGHKVPQGFQRVKPEVVMYSDGSGFSYDIVDVQKAVHFPIGSKYRATRIVIENSKELLAGAGLIERVLK